MELVKLQRTMLGMKIKQKCKLYIYAFELEDKIVENKFNVELHQKELHLLQLIIIKKLNDLQTFYLPV